LKTSVIIPTRNSGMTIEQTLSSLMPYYKTGYINDIVVVDGHSSDNTLEIVKNYPVKLIFDEGKGEYAARQMGWPETTGDLLLFIDNDAYIGKDFLPAVQKFFDDEKVGIVGIWARAVVTNQISRTIGEWWVYHAGSIKGLVNQPSSSWSPLQRLYNQVVLGGGKQVVTTGPCYIVRRSCMEALNGFHCHRWSEDICLSRRIVEKGWKAVWWFDGEVYHHPPVSSRQLMKQRYHWGKADASLQQGTLTAWQKIALMVTKLGTPLMGLRLTIRFGNLQHLVLFPLAHYTWSAGYLAQEFSFIRAGRNGSNN
jgi:glycosyltransferase involved in cell wall biosynthesis